MEMLGVGSTNSSPRGLPRALDQRMGLVCRTKIHQNTLVGSFEIVEIVEILKSPIFLE